MPNVVKDNLSGCFVGLLKQIGCLVVMALVVAACLGSIVLAIGAN